MAGWVYILASKHYGTLYTGVTSDLVGRAYTHRAKIVKGFTTRYQIGLLVWFEGHDTIETAIVREKQIKEWRRDWKVRLIEESNPGWLDLYDTICR
ncbi:GIY-YIG nuclease family protein [Oleomonas cavernae]|uniref:GIY-YIG nuclease family protein n=1 Tax=Oleomonas cavernae TaxID=2320859 RepID=A0A418WB60_9PROT|nr:GIY-YIG nuclease family protein [Oleomonas cavernae]RJF87214.1 GIY-YIG nuclease family protein [Oleomonas cavernae]